jgi:hypothetical protein
MPLLQGLAPEHVTLHLFTCASQVTGASHALASMHWMLHVEDAQSIPPPHALGALHSILHEGELEHLTLPPQLDGPLQCTRQSVAALQSTPPGQEPSVPLHLTSQGIPAGHVTRPQAALDGQSMRHVAPTHVPPALTQALCWQVPASNDPAAPALVPPRPPVDGMPPLPPAASTPPAPPCELASGMAPPLDPPAPLDPAPPCATPPCPPTSLPPPLELVDSLPAPPIVGAPPAEGAPAPPVPGAVGSVQWFIVQTRPGLQSVSELQLSFKVWGTGHPAMSSARAPSDDFKNPRINCFAIVTEAEDRPKNKFP